MWKEIPEDRSEAVKDTAGRRFFLPQTISAKSRVGWEEEAGKDGQWLSHKVRAEIKSHKAISHEAEIRGDASRCVDDF